MAKFTVTIDTDNDAFADDPHAEVARILAEQVIDALHDGWDTINLRDVNGNHVGEARFTDDD